MIRQIRFMDLPEKTRRQHGEAMIRDLRRALFMPLPEAHRERLEARIQEVTAQMQGSPAPPPPAPMVLATPPAVAVSMPVHHVVTVTEGLAVNDKLK